MLPDVVSVGTTLEVVLGYGMDELDRLSGPVPLDGPGGNGNPGGKGNPVGIGYIRSPVEVIDATVVLFIADDEEVGRAPLVLETETEEE